jgi:pyrroline-5-carboxylate reductase
MSIVFVGGGNMASALIGGLIGRGWQAADLSVVEIAAEARRALEQRYGLAVSAELPPRIGADAVVLLAVKPQHMRQVAAALRAKLSGQLVVTIAAGIRTADLSRWLGGHARIVRVMPNTPALVQAGVSALYAMPGVAAEDCRLAESILAAVGSTLWVQREELMDAVTAVSGSGPAYVFYFIEALADAGRELGLDAAAARLLALDTFHGAAALARSSDDPPAVLRARVTSKGGTTEAALRVLEEQSVRERIIEAIKRAAARSREMGEELGRSD